MNEKFQGSGNTKMTRMNCDAPAVSRLAPIGSLISLLLLLPGPARAGGVGTETASSFASAWPEGITRTWVGPDYYANRMLDWRIHEGRLECLEGSRRKPMRTVHLLTRDLGPEPGTLLMSVRTGPGEGASSSPDPDTWTGFLVGTGGESVDYRIRALCHHWPGPDGGLIVAVDGTGRVVFRDNERPGVPWNTRKIFPSETWPELPSGDREGPGFEGTAPGAMILELRAAPEADGNGYALTLEVRAAGDGALINRATARQVAPHYLEGNVALLSHESPGGKGRGYWFEEWRVSGTKVRPHEDRAFGPVLCALYTLSRGVLKMTAQMPPLGPEDDPVARLQFMEENGTWKTATEGCFQAGPCIIPFRVEGYRADRDRPYRILYDLRRGKKKKKTFIYEGVIRKEPGGKRPFVLAAFTGHHISARGGGAWNGNAIWYPHAELTAAVRHFDPDFLFFSGDQIYEGGLAGIVRAPVDRAILDYLYHWYRWCWAFRDLARDVPCVCIPDDHDVYHGNLWGAGGRHADRIDDGGYLMDPRFVNAVQATQTGQLPDPYDPTPAGQGIGVYYCALDYGGVSFAVIEDRKWKSSPTVMVPEGRVKNGWFRNKDFDPAKEADVPGAVLLGDRQLAFLRHWADDWSGGVWMKVLLSQTIFANVATLPEGASGDEVVPRLEIPEPGMYVQGDRLAADADSNGWPSTGRNKALRAIRRGFAFHIAGDQHLGSFIHYGVEAWNDAAYALCVPSIANVWPRRWFPPHPGRNPRPGLPPYTGEYRDGFGNLVTVLAVSNPRRTHIHPEALYDRAPGYGIVRLDRATRKITAELWPRWVDPSKPEAKPYEGWPVTVDQRDNYGRRPAAYLPRIEVKGMVDPVVQVKNEASGETVYTLRIQGNSFRPWVFREEGSYTVRIGEPGTPRMKILRGLRPGPLDSEVRMEVRL